ncbi:hypothetical protein J6590_004290 [Homalodisca vitripennis]|nr:hypothetical protein J6590_004290 [Homalodisca vitripennis]
MSHSREELTHDGWLRNCTLGTGFTKTETMHASSDYEVTTRKKSTINKDEKFGNVITNEWENLRERTGATVIECLMSPVCYRPIITPSSVIFSANPNEDLIRKSVLTNKSVLNQFRDCRVGLAAPPPINFFTTFSSYLSPEDEVLK